MKIFALMSAIALTSAVGFTACSSSSDATDSTADVNPTFDGTSVRTDFAFNITKASQGTTRMTAANTQENGQAFLGIEHMYLFPFNVVPADNTTSHLSFASSTNPSASNKNFSLGAIESSELYTTPMTTTDPGSPSKKIYSLSMPIGTNNFLFYGKAIRGTKNGFAAGRLTSSFYTADNAKATGADAVANTDNINFSLVGIASDLGADATNLAAYLTRIAQTTDWAGTVDIVTNHTGSNPDAYSSLADLYAKFTHINSDRCGSAEAIKRTVLDLYKSAKAINAKSSVTEVQTIANAICARIVDTGYSLRMTVTDSDPDPDKWTFDWVGLANTNFPANLNLPMGAAQLAFDSSSKTFSYKTAVASGTTMVTGVDYKAICYPSELVYFDNSPLRATNNYKTADNYSSNTQDWDIQYQDPTSGDWTGKEVLSTTRAVAMQNNVNYGVAMLESTIQLTASPATALVDNKKAVLGGSAENQVDIDGNKMTVTGLLIGGQPGTVGWNMVKTSSAGFDHVIYDHDIQYNLELSNYTSTASGKNYTIVLDNYTTSAQQDEVRIALELVNGDKDFYGQNGLIPKNHTFYLIGSLSSSTYSSSDPRVVPKVKTGTGAGDEVLRTASSYRITNEDTERVFIQDYKTIANIKINTNSLQKAYSSIPDLRSTELLFGLSVDLKWEQGNTYDVNL